MVRISETGEGFDARFAASPRRFNSVVRSAFGEAGYTRVWVSPGELADALDGQGLLTA